MDYMISLKDVLEWNTHPYKRDVDLQIDVSRAAASNHMELHVAVYDRKSKNRSVILRPRLDPMCMSPGEVGELLRSVGEDIRMCSAYLQATGQEYAEARCREIAAAARLFADQEGD